MSLVEGYNTETVLHLIDTCTNEMSLVEGYNAKTLPPLKKR